MFAETRELQNLFNDDSLECSSIKNRLPDTSNTKGKYLYHFGNLSRLISYRRSDPFLRAREHDGTEPVWLHRQVVDTLPSLKEGERVYCLFFWNDLDSMRANAYSMMKGSVLHRVRADHPVLKRFKSGEDEFLKGMATMYWQAMVANKDNPHYSPIGIPHSDIEVLHPDGRWKTMGQIPILSDATHAGWTANIVEANGNVRLVFSRMATRPVINSDGSTSYRTEACVLLRHPAGGGISFLGMLELLEPLVLNLATPHTMNVLSQLRWFYAYEDLEEVRVQEFFPIFHRRKKSGLKQIALEWLDVPKKIIDWVTFNDRSPHSLADKEVADLYRLFGCSEALIRGNKWSYEHLLYDEGTYASLKGSSADLIYGST